MCAGNAATKGNIPSELWMNVTLREMSCWTRNASRIESRPFQVERRDRFGDAISPNLGVLLIDLGRQICLGPDCLGRSVPGHHLRREFSKVFDISRWAGVMGNDAEVLRRKT